MIFWANYRGLVEREHDILLAGNLKDRAMAAGLVTVALAILLLAAPVEAKKKFKLYNLKAYPTEVQRSDFIDDYIPICTYRGGTGKESFDACAERNRELSQVRIMEKRGPILINAEILVGEGLQEFAVMLDVENGKGGTPVEVVPEKVFLVDDKGAVHLAVPEYETRAAIAAEHHLPPFSPPPPQTYYTITQVPISSQPTGPMQMYAIQDIGTGYLVYGAQPQITTYQNVVAANRDWGPVIGYEIRHLLRAWLIKRDAKRQLEWIDKGWFHSRLLLPGQFESGLLLFEDVLSRPFKSLAPRKPSDDWVDDLLRSPLDGPVKLVIFVENQQFVLQFGPEIVEQKNP